MSHSPVDDDDDLGSLFGFGSSPPVRPVVTAATPPPLGLNVGATYNHPRDFDRLSSNRQRALLLLLDGQRHSNVELSRSPAEGGAGLEGLRRVRELTGEVWGPFTIHKDESDHGLVWYTLDLGSVTQHKLDKVFQNRPDEPKPLKLLRGRVRKLVLDASEAVLLRVEALLQADASDEDAPFSGKNFWDEFDAG